MKFWLFRLLLVFALTGGVLSVLRSFPDAPSGGSQEVPGECVIRGTAAGSELVITTTARVAGAIHSLSWAGQEFIDSSDHGRQLQSASNFDLGTQFHPETFNPTEAGSRSDGAGPLSTSRLLHIVRGKNWVQTTSQMAFWLQPGQTSSGQLAKNASSLSNHLLTKRVEIGIPGFDNVIRYQVTFSTPLGERHHLAQFEVLTGYMPIEFRAFYTLSMETGELTELDDGPGEQGSPVILATRDGRYAMGAIAVSAPSGAGWSGPGYGRFAFDRQQVTKWNVVYRLRNSEAVAAGDYTFEIRVVVGDLERVRSTLLKLVPDPRGESAPGPVGIQQSASEFAKSHSLADYR